MTRFFAMTCPILFPRRPSKGNEGYPPLVKPSLVTFTAPPPRPQVWQYIVLMKRVHLIDCPGIVYDTGDSETATVLKGVVRSEKLDCPELYIEGPCLLFFLAPNRP